MDYRDEEYLNLFKQVREQNISYPLTETNSFSGQMLKETPNYSNYESFRNFDQPSINEVQRNNYSQDFNLNEFNIETRINGESINEVKRQGREDRLNEVMQNLRQERLNEIKKTTDNQNINETVNFGNVDYVTLEMFEKARFNSMMQVARILPK